ncbi:hypothetical protein K466DRAFT_502790 [Polyporus arcularius HHB13444]|uniref:Uncharacterized protein n=1 Tax=Polyporus arcularius HHB13444 TaxID=1314778 RepID=A0A5C3NXI9_9APHY|nr:hypothetical protein K466DRAFT_502790 [Polyporus arcularius HHB13444]
MAPGGWPDDEQQDWLEDRNDAAIEARRHAGYNNWLTATCHDWFLIWSEKTRLFGPDAGILTPEQEEILGNATRHKQAVKRGRGAKAHVIVPSTSGASAGPSRAAIKSQLVTGKATRAPQAREVYCRMYYDDSQKAMVTEELAAERDLLGRALTKAERMSISRRLIDGFYEEAPEEVKEDVQTRVAGVKAARKATPPPDGPNRVRTPEEYQKYVPLLQHHHACSAAIDAAPRLIYKLVEPVHEDTGWCFTVVGAGPSPRHGGAIKSFA